MIEVGIPGDGTQDVAIGGPRRLPDRIAVLPLRDAVTFPELVVPLNVGQERSVELVNDVLRGDRSIVLLAGRDPSVETPTPEQLYDVGVLGTVARMVRLPDETLRVLIQGAQRVRVTGWSQTEPYLVAEVDEAPDVVTLSAELTALTRNVQREFTTIVGLVPYLPEELSVMVANVEDPVMLSHLISGALRLPTAEKQALLEELDVTKRLRRLSQVLARELEVAEIGTKIQSQVQSELEKGQREYFLRQQLKAIQEELGEGDEAQAEANELRAQLEAIKLPEEVSKQVDRELGRLERLQPAMAEYGVVRTYLEWIASLPWDTATEDNLDLEHARRGARRRPLRHRAGQGPDPRVPGRAVAEARCAGVDPHLRRPPGRRQDLSGPIDRPCAGPAVSSASASVASATRRRSAATAARTSARCRA